MEKSFTKEELVEQLKKLANDKSNIAMHRGAMCYEPAMPEILETTCSHCGKQIKFSDYYGYDQWENHFVDQIRDLGYDAKIESWCIDCAVNEGLLQSNETDDVKMPQLDEYARPYARGGRCPVFFFKTKDSEQYHRAVIHDTNDLKAVVAFLEKDNKYEGSNGQTIPLRDRLDLVTSLTGIS